MWCAHIYAEEHSVLRVRVTKHKGSSRAVLVSTVVAFILVALAGWAVGRFADTTVELITSEGPLAVDTDWPGSLLGVLVPASATASVDSENRPTSETLGRWARAEGGADAGHTTIDLTIYGLEDYPIIVTGIRATDVQCMRPDEDQTLITVEGGGNFNALALKFEIDQSTESEAGVPVPSSEELDTEASPWAFPRQVSRAEADHFLLDLRAEGGAICDFNVTIDFTARGKDEHLLVTHDDGSRFVVADPTLAVDEVDLGRLGVVSASE